MLRFTSEDAAALADSSTAPSAAVRATFVGTPAQESGWKQPRPPVCGHSPKQITHAEPAPKNSQSVSFVQSKQFPAVALQKPALPVV